MPDNELQKRLKTQIHETVEMMLKIMSQPSPPPALDPAEHKHQPGSLLSRTPLRIDGMQRRWLLLRPHVHDRQILAA